MLAKRGAVDFDGATVRVRSLDRLSVTPPGELNEMYDECLAAIRLGVSLFFQPKCPWWSDPSKCPFYRQWLETLAGKQ